MSGVVLDPPEVATSDRKELSLEGGGLKIRKDPGPDWGDAAIVAYIASKSYGAAMIDYDLPPRKVVLPLVVEGSKAGGNFDGLRNRLQSWVSRVNEEGGWVKRTMPSGKVYFADVFEANLHLSSGWFSEHREADLEAAIEFQALPDFYQAWVEEPAVSGNGEASKTFTVKGNLPGRAELTINELSGNAQRAFFWHFRCRNYNAAAEAAWAMGIAAQFERIGSAEEATLAGSIGTKVVKHPSLATTWTGIAAKTCLHRGTYDVWVRVYTTSTTKVRLRLLFDVGDMIAPSENEQVEIPGANAFYLLNLGQVSLKEPPFGTYRWRALIQALGESGGENVYLDRIWFLDATECSGTPSAPKRDTIGIAAPLVFDAFNQSAGNATGKSPQVGAAYAVATNSAATDFTIEATNHYLRRSSVSDAGTLTPVFKGRAIGAGTAKYTDFNAAMNIYAIPAGEGYCVGFLFRYVNSENFALAYVNWSILGWTLAVTKYVGKTESLVRYENLTGYGYVFEGRLELSLVGGEITASIGGKQIFTVKDADMLPGGALGEGRVLIYDHNTTATANVRIFDNYEVWSPTYDAVNYPNRSAKLRYDGLFRYGPDGVSPGDLSRPISDLPRIPVSGFEGRPVEVAVKSSRGDLEAMADASNNDALSYVLKYRPCWSVIPGE